MKITTLLWCVAVVSACANVPTPNAAEAARLAEARRLLATAPLQSLDVAESLLADNPRLREARLLAAEGSLAVARAPGEQRAHLHLQDASRNFELALEGVDDNDYPSALKSWAECEYELGEFADASTTAQRAANALAAPGTEFARRDGAAALLLAGRADLQQFVLLRQRELDRGEKDSRGIVAPSRKASELAMTAGAHFVAARPYFPGESTTNVALIHRWLDQPGEATIELERGLRESPTESAIHDAYIAWMCENSQFDAMVGAYSRFVRENPATPILRWHQGRALYARADKLRQDGSFKAAAAMFGKADAAFGEYLAMVPAHAAATNQWRALCNLQHAQVAVDMGDLITAQDQLLRAGETSPAVTAHVDGDPLLFSRTAFAIHRALADGGDDALSRTLAWNEQLLQRFPDRFGFVYNNAALAARDLGVQKANAGDTTAAQALWQRSYSHYEKAVQLSPTDARIINDCGLMLLYHLDRDLGHARELFDRTITTGTAQLAALPANTARDERERIEEAVGDAYQNLAVLLRDKQQQPTATWRPFCEQAVQYFPHQRREAAAMLRELDAKAAAPQGGGAEALAKQADAIKAKVAASDFDGALTLLDTIAQDCKAHAPYYLLRGDITLQLAEQAKQQGRKGIDFFYQDAVAAFTRAVELDAEPAAPRQKLAQAQFGAGDLAGCVKTLSSLLLHLQSQGGGKPDDLLAAHGLRADAAARSYAQQKQADANADDKDLLAAARTSFRLLEEKGQLTTERRTLWSVTEQWAGAGAEAVQVYVRALAKTPDDLALLEALLNTAAATQQIPLAVEALGKRTDATGLWYLGKARYWLADVERQANKTADAQRTLDAARGAFGDSMQKNAAYRDSCEQWSAMVLGKKGNIAFWTDDLANAEKWLLEAARTRPDQVATDLGLAETTKLGLMRLADKFFKQNDLAKTEAIYRAASDAANSDLDLLNNSGLFARDHGNELERAGKDKEAMAMYEQSYKAYRRALLLDAGNVRLRNDCALIAIHHLDRDWDECKKWLDGAIADGEKTLRDNPPEDPNDKQQLDEAVGDCYENLALWHLKHSKDAAAAKAAAQQSTKHHPGERRPGARRHLQAAERLLQGK